MDCLKNIVAQNISQKSILMCITYFSINLSEITPTNGHILLPISILWPIKSKAFLKAQTLCNTAKNHRCAGTRHVSTMYQFISFKAFCWVHNILAGLAIVESHYKFHVQTRSKLCPAPLDCNDNCPTNIAKLKSNNCTSCVQWPGDVIVFDRDSCKIEIQ